MEGKININSAVKAKIFNGNKPVAAKADITKPAVAPKAEAPKVEVPKVEAKPATEKPVSPKPAKESNGKKQQVILIAAIAAVVLAIIVAIVAIVLTNNKPEEPAPIDPSSLVKPLTEEEKRITEQTVNEYVDIEVEGYKQEGDRTTVIINIKNSGQKQTCLALDIVAKDENGTIIDKTSLYAEGIEPGQTQRFFAFELSQLKPEQLASAKYEIYKARTYELNTGSNE